MTIESLLRGIEKFHTTEFDPEDYRGYVVRGESLIKLGETLERLALCEELHIKRKLINK